MRYDYYSRRRGEFSKILEENYEAFHKQGLVLFLVSIVLSVLLCLGYAHLGNDYSVKLFSVVLFCLNMSWGIILVLSHHFGVKNIHKKMIDLNNDYVLTQDTDDIPDEKQHWEGKVVNILNVAFANFGFVLIVAVIIFYFMSFM